jgi:hypothetical protein
VLSLTKSRNFAFFVQNICICRKIFVILRRKMYFDSIICDKKMDIISLFLIVGAIGLVAFIGSVIYFNHQER